MAASVGHTITIFSSAGENATLANIAFGDVFLCGGQSNMVFAVPALTNASAETAAADSYPHIRIFTVGIGTQSAMPLRDLKTVREPWQVASSKTVSEDVTPGHTLFATFSAVCWVFGRTVSDALTTAGHTRADGGPVPLGLKQLGRHAAGAMDATRCHRAMCPSRSGRGRGRHVPPPTGWSRQ